MRKHFVTTALPLAIIGTLLLAACAGGGPEPQATATPRPGTSAPTPTAAAYKPPHTKPGPAAEKILFRAFDVDRAPLDFQAGQMDAYLFSLKTNAARELRGKEGVRLEEAPATIVSLVMNPAPAPQSQINPFAIKEIRQAVQYLVNRDSIAAEIYRGAAMPMLTHLSPTDFDYLTVFDVARSSDYRYDPERARAIIKREMEKAGARLVNERWEFQGRPVRLKFVIRVEDERREIGDLVRAELERAGFTVAPTYQQFAPAVLAVYSSDPQAFEWHLYTEGWSRGAPQRYDFASINSFAAPWQGNMPGWRESGFWQYENAQLDELGQRLFTGSFGSEQERNDLYRRMTQLALDESVRAWVVTVNNSFPLQTKLQGITSDLVAGPKTQRSIREAYIPGKDEITLGNLWVWTERTTWNPVGGFGDLYSNDIWRHLADPPIVNHPFSGEPVPFRATFQVETAGPAGKLDVPPDAILWDAQADRWKDVGPGVRATSKVTYDFSKYLNAKWHDGQPITMADALYPLAQSYELAFDPEKSRIEFAIGVTARPFLNTFRGYRIADGAKMEVYVDFWHFDRAQIGSYAAPAGFSMPWEVLAAMDDLVFTQRRAAYSDTAAARFNVTWLSLVQRRDAGLVERTLRQFQADNKVPAGYFTVGNRSLVSPQEAQARYQAAIDWFNKYGLLVISQGPFYLTKFDPPAQFAEITAFRDPSYPFKPGDFYLGSTPLLEILQAQTAPVRAGRDAEVTVQVRGPGAIGVRYALFDPAAGKVLHTGEATPGTGGRLSVKLDAAATAKLQPGLYKLILAAYSSELASLAERQVDLEVRP